METPAHKQCNLQPKLLWQSRHKAETAESPAEAEAASPDSRVTGRGRSSLANAGRISLQSLRRSATRRCSAVVFVVAREGVPNLLLFLLLIILIIFLPAGAVVVAFAGFSSLCLFFFGFGLPLAPAPFLFFPLSSLALGWPPVVLPPPQAAAYSELYAGLAGSAMAFCICSIKCARIASAAKSVGQTPT